MDDDLINGMGDTVIGTVTAHMYFADHDSARLVEGRPAVLVCDPGDP
jgi:hypothetical protein